MKRNLEMTEEQNKMFIEYKDTAANIAKKWFKNQSKKYLEYDECIDIAWQTLIYAIKGYKPELNNNFLGYVNVAIKKDLLNAFNRNRKTKSSLISYDFAEENNDAITLCNTSSSLEDTEFKITLDKFLDGLKKDDKYIFVQAYVYGKNKFDIGNDLGVSHQTVYNRLRALKEQFKTYYESLKK